MAWSKYLSCVNVNFYDLDGGRLAGFNGVICSSAASFMYIICLRFAKHVRLVLLHVQLRIHGGVVFLGVCHFVCWLCE